MTRSRISQPLNEGKFVRGKLAVTTLIPFKSQKGKTRKKTIRRNQNVSKINWPRMLRMTVYVFRYISEVNSKYAIR